MLTKKQKITLIGGIKKALKIKNISPEQEIVIVEKVLSLFQVLYKKEMALISKQISHLNHSVFDIKKKEKISQKQIDSISVNVEELMHLVDESMIVPIEAVEQIQQEESEDEYLNSLTKIIKKDSGPN